MSRISTVVLLAMGFVLAAGLAGGGEAAPTASPVPVVRFLDVDAGPTRGGPEGLGVPIAIYGTGFGKAVSRVRVTIGGRPVARVLSLETRPFGARPLDVIVVQPGSGVRSGPVVVTAGGGASPASVRFRPTRGRVLRVAPAGSTTGDCAFARPCATLTQAVTVARAGDAVLVDGPDVADDEVWVRPEAGGRAGAPIVIRAMPGVRPVFRLAGRPVILEGSHLRFAGFAFTGGKSLVVGGNGSADIRVVDNTFEGAIGYDAIGTHGNDLLVAGNRCRVSGSSQGTQGHCFYVSNGRGIRLLDNLAEGAPGYGIHVFDQQRSADDARREIRDVLVEGNLLAASTERSGLIVAMGDEGGRGNAIVGVTIRDNVFTANNFAGVAIGSRVSGVTIERNTFVGNGRQGVTVYDDETTSDVAIRRNLFDQRPNDACRSNCAWYRRAAVEVGRRARSVRVEGNWFVPGAPTVLGGRDSSRRAGAVRYRAASIRDFRVVSPPTARGFGTSLG